MCTCGHPTEPHLFRHTPVPIEIQITEDDKGVIFLIDALDYPENKKTTICKFPQCGKGKGLHGTILKHEFKGETYTQRIINFEIPKDTKCRYLGCNETLENHTLKHIFEYKIEILNKGEKDLLKIL